MSRSLFSSKLLCLYRGVVERVYILYINKGFIFYRSSISALTSGKVGLLFNNSFEPFFKIVDMEINALENENINSLDEKGAYSHYSHEVLLTLSYRLICRNPLFHLSSVDQTKVLSIGRFGNEYLSIFGLVT